MSIRFSVAVAAVAVLISAFLTMPALAGSICRDGTYSQSEGRGTCSGHGGVAVSGVADPAGSSTGVPASPASPATPAPVVTPVPASTDAAAPSLPAPGSGSICRDGTYSRSVGRGTCSGHGGVAVSGVADPASASPASPVSPAPVASPAPATAATPAPIDVAPISAPAAATGSFAVMVESIAVAVPTITSPTGAAYDRSSFKLWVTVDGCSTREMVLIAEAVGGTRTGCSMNGATWLSRYDGVQTSNPGSFDIDHMVPLKEAWLSGAAAWSSDRRTAYANDIGWSQSLVAVSARSNRQKSDRDPAKWMPDSTPFVCAYTQSWVGVKYRWGLSMDAAERAKVDAVLAGCTADFVALPDRVG